MDGAARLAADGKDGMPTTANRHSATAILVPMVKPPARSLVQRFAIMMTYSASRGRPLLSECESDEQGGQILSRKRPFERPRGRFIVLLKGEQRGFKAGEISEISGRQHLALDNREIDLD